VTHLKQLLSPMTFGDLHLNTRIAFAPCTRCKSPGFLPTEEVAAYYARRAADGVGLQISEGTVICERANGYSGAPGIWNAIQVKAWQRVTKAVHDAGGAIACQLWHVGAVAHPLTTGGLLPESPSGRSPEGRIARLRQPDGEDVYYGPSEAMREQRITEVIELFARAAGNAMQAGFDAVEIHGAHGYLIDQFTNLAWNRRDDEWGGGQRCRFAGAVTRAVLAECGPGRTIFRFSPKMSVSGQPWEAPRETFQLLLDELKEAGLKLLHASNLDYAEVIPGLDEALCAFTRKHWPGKLIGVGSLDAVQAEAALAKGEMDLAAWGRALIANPDFVSRLKMGLEPRPYDQAMLDTLV
jgi:N-ethylmaleimide reductase